MPELPEVEFTARQLRGSIINATILSAQVFWERAIGFPELALFQAEIANQRILAIRRRGKYLIFELTDQQAADARPAFIMTVHRRMTGNLYLLSPHWHIDTSLRETNPTEWSVKGPVFYSDAPAEDTQYTPQDLRYCRVCFHLADGRLLLFNDQRKFGRVELWPIEQEAQALAGLGPEPLDTTFTQAALAERLAYRKSPIKQVLLDQEVIAGLGNIYADEALYQASINPLRPANTLTPEEIEKLHQGIVTVLSGGLNYGGTTFSGYRGLQGEQGANYDHLMVYHRPGEEKRCERCGTQIAHTVIAQRTAHYCPSCQPSPRIEKLIEE